MAKKRTKPEPMEFVDIEPKGIVCRPSMAALYNTEYFSVRVGFTKHSVIIPPIDNATVERIIVRGVPTSIYTPTAESAASDEALLLWEENQRSYLAGPYGGTYAKLI